MISLTGVTKVYNGKRQVAALESVDLEIARGEMVSIVGSSGSGKSTLLNLIGGLDRPTSGEIRIDGQTVAGLSDDGLTRLRRVQIRPPVVFVTTSSRSKVSVPIISPLMKTPNSPTVAPPARAIIIC